MELKSFENLSQKHKFFKFLKSSKVSSIKSNWKFVVKFIHSCKCLCEIILVKIKLFQISKSSQQWMKYL